MTTKKYLKTVEEVLALKDTDTKIYSDGSEGYYQFIQGTLCYFFNDGDITISSEIGIGKEYLDRYILVEEPVKEADENDIGKLCWFYTGDSTKDLDFLKEIRKGSINPYISYDYGHYEHCRRLSPSEVAEMTGYRVEE